MVFPSTCPARPLARYSDARASERKESSSNCASPSTVRAESWKKDERFRRAREKMLEFQRVSGRRLRKVANGSSVRPPASLRSVGPPARPPFIFARARNATPAAAIYEPLETERTSALSLCGKNIRERRKTIVCPPDGQSMATNQPASLLRIHVQNGLLSSFFVS